MIHERFADYVKYCEMVEPVLGPEARQALLSVLRQLDRLDDMTETFFAAPWPAAAIA